MADISKITLPDGSNTYDIISKKTRGLYRGEVDSTSTSSAFTAQINGITELYDGLAILLNNPVVTGESGMTININGLGAKVLWSSYQNVATATGFKVDTEWLIYFDATNDRWVIYEGTYTTTNLYAGPCKAGTNGIKNRALLMPVSNTTWESCTTGSGTGPSKARNTNGFLINGNEIDIRYYSSTSNIASGSNTGRTNTFQCYSADSRYSTNGGGSWSALGRSFYLKGTITSGKFYLHTTWWADALPSTADGFYYVYVGQMYDAYRFTLATNHPIFYYDENNGIQRYYPSYIDAATVNEHTVNSDVPSNAVFTDTKNTAGATNNTNSRLYLIGATEQTANPQTYTNENVSILRNSLWIKDSVSYHGSFSGPSTSLAHTKYYSDLGWDPETITYLGVNNVGILGTAEGDPDEDIYPPNDSKNTPAQGFYYLANFSVNPENGKIIISDGTYGKIKTSSLSPSDLLVKQNNAGFHNSIYRGEYLGTSVTAAQWEAINNGTFDDLYIGDYWTIDSVNYRIAHFDYWYNRGTSDNNLIHHVVIVPDTLIGDTKAMNNTATTTGGYKGSAMFTSNLDDAKTIVNNAFGSSHVYSTKLLLSDTVSGGAASSGGWYTVTLSLMSETMITGHPMYSNSMYEFGIDLTQFQLFNLRPEHIRCSNSHYWLRTVKDSTRFVAMSNVGGLVNSSEANLALGVRPCFAICQVQS